MSLTAMLALVFAHPAGADTWAWGPGWLGSTTSNNNNCWYSTGEVCSGWNYWVNNYLDKQTGGGGLVLQGFENSERIRGAYRSDPGFYIITVSEVGMGGYLKGQVTWWGDPASYIVVETHTL
jgi:hypothetical protein